MKNQYFKEMQRIGKSFRRKNPQGAKKPFSEGQSYAYKFWAIADHYNSTDILVDSYPSEEELGIFVETYRQAGIKTIVVIKEAARRRSELIKYGCQEKGECKVFRRETELFWGELEVIKGIRIIIEKGCNE